MANFLVQHNIPLAVADDLKAIFRSIFPDSLIAKSYGSGRTKTTCMLNNAIAPGMCSEKCITVFSVHVVHLSFHSQFLFCLKHIFLYCLHVHI